MGNAANEEKVITLLAELQAERETSATLRDALQELKLLRGKPLTLVPKYLSRAQHEDPASKLTAKDLAPDEASVLSGGSKGSKKSKKGDEGGGVAFKW